MATRRTKSRPASCREGILRAALRHFAHRGYAGASIQDIVDAARVTKPALYYHFPSKEALYRALVDQAQDERYRLMREAAARAPSAAEQCVEIASSLFEFAQTHQELTRLMLAAAFAAPGEVPASVKNLTKGRRNFEFVVGRLVAGQKAGELTRRYSAEELAFFIFGQINVSIMAHVLLPDCHLDRAKAKRVVALCLEGARAPRRPSRSTR